MLARVGLAFVHVQFTAVPSVTFWTVADETVHVVFARSTIDAGVAGAFVDVRQAASVVVTSWTVALEAIY